MSSANQQVEGKDRNTNDTVTFQAVRDRIHAIIDGFAGQGTPPHARSDDYTYAAILLHFAERLAAYRNERQRQRPPRTGYADLPEYLRVYMDRWARSIQSAGQFAGTPGNPVLPGPVLPGQPGINKPGDDTPPDLLGWQIYIITRPDLRAPDRTEHSNTTQSSDNDCDDNDDDDSDNSQGQSTTRSRSES